MHNLFQENCFLGETMTNISRLRPEADPPPPRSVRKRLRKWLRVAVWVVPPLLFVGVGSYLFLRVHEVYTEWREARGCLAYTSSVEGNVLDEVGERMIAETIVNNARRLQGEESFPVKICLAATGKHLNKNTRQPTPDYSALMAVGKALLQNRWQRAGWERSSGIARGVLMRAVLEGLGWPFTLSVLGPEYTHYHNAPAPEVWKRANGGLLCDRPHTYKNPAGKEYKLDFCKVAPKKPVVVAKKQKVL